MQLTSDSLKTARQWRSVLGCDAHHFQELLVIFGEAYRSVHGAQLADRLLLNPVGSRIGSEQELLFFTLFSCTSGLTYDVLGHVGGMDGATAKRRQEEGLAVLREALKKGGHLPERAFSSPGELQRYFTKRRAVLLDATEFATQRPQEHLVQKQRYSGKKTTHAKIHAKSACYKSVCYQRRAQACGLAEPIGRRLTARFYLAPTGVAA